MTDREWVDSDAEEKPTKPIPISRIFNLRDVPVAELRAEWAKWNDRVVNAPHWGAALAAAAEFRDNAARELRRRGEPVPQ